MFVVLSEINCLKMLNNRGIHPDEFYTDINLFRKHSILFREATVLVIFGGNSQFNKKHTIEFIKGLLKRMEDNEDQSIKNVFVVSDMTISGLKSYYKYEGSIDNLSVMKGWDVVKTGVSFWDKLVNDKRDCRVFLSDFDLCNKDEIKSKYPTKGHPQDAYVDLIKIPNLKEMIYAS